MIKITELRIGNMVLDHLGRILKVSGIKDDYVYCTISNGCNLKYHINTFKPIPITKEMLLEIEGYNSDIFELEITDIEFLHDLQNCYYFHRNTKKELNTNK